MTATTTTVVDVRFAGGAVLVEGSQFAGGDVVRLAFPGANPVPLFEHEARALAAALVAHADAIGTSTNRSSRAHAAVIADRVEAEARPIVVPRMSRGGAT